MTLPHLLAIEGLERSQIEALLLRARELGRTPEPSRLTGKVVANLFFEASTRTRLSFEIAAKRLGAEVINWTVAGSSAAKGEGLLDTARNVDATGVSAIVMRHGSSGACELVASQVKAAVINAGDGCHEHPTQALLDAMTLIDHFGSIAGKTVVIVGDVLHSRVARSNLWCLTKLGARVIFCGPPTLLPLRVQTGAADLCTDCDRALEGADAVIALRLQLERQSQSWIPSLREYARLYGIDERRAKLLKKGAPILHPGPINRGVELSSAVADGPSSLVLDQVANGVAVRMAVLEACGDRRG